MGFNSFLRFLLSWFPPPLAEFATDLAFLMAASFIDDPFIFEVVFGLARARRGPSFGWVGVCRLEGKWPFLALSDAIWRLGVCWGGCGCCRREGRPGLVAADAVEIYGKTEIAVKGRDLMRRAEAIRSATPLACAALLYFLTPALPMTRARILGWPWRNFPGLAWVWR